MLAKNVEKILKVCGYVDKYCGKLCAFKGIIDWKHNVFTN
jgi:hypothetical protein